ncbi:sensor histidine kinase KdpD [Acinetobacter sp. YH1901134]|uniref:sensor histidine kinase n=1 Tax=Acinetobacter sp. YH1901134 TaxID=2601199 RepID=UPI0015D37931|nr:ATP-binding protein [Acinetobacter sp. YH1901134]
MDEISLSPFPEWEIEQQVLHDGIFFKKTRFCNINSGKKTCKKFYEGIKNIKGFHSCPYSFTTYVDPLTNKIYSGIRVQNNYHPKKIDGYVPTIPESYFLESITKLNRIDLNQSFLNDKDSDLVDFSIHEIRKFNQQIKRICEELFLNDSAKFDLQDKFQNIFACSSLISTRLNIFDIEKNPDLIRNRPRNQIGIYKKFDKAIKCLASYAREKKIKINKKGASHLTLNADQVFDFLPYLLLENAIKYSPRDSEVEVTFTEKTNFWTEVVINSVGPLVTQEELEKIYIKKYRGLNASTFNSEGGGYGLFFVKLICDSHNIEIDIKSDKSSKFIFQDIWFAPFIVTLKYQR